MENYYYIDTGAKTMMYTLRHHYFEKRVIGSGSEWLERDYYCGNLSTNWDKAVEKAKARCNGDLRELSEFDLEKIRALEAQKSAELLIAEQEEYDRQQGAMFDKFDALIEGGVFPFGKYKNKEICKLDKDGNLFSPVAPVSYIRFIANLEIEGNERFDICMRNLQVALRAWFPEITKALPKANGEYFGKEGTRYPFKAVCVARYGFEGYYGYTHIIKFVSETGELLVYMGAGNVDCDESDVLTFNAKVKAHEDYEGEKQTKIQRMTKIAKAA